MRVEQIGDATLYCGDCLEILPTLEKVDVIISDPPYGEKQAEWDNEKPPEYIWNLYFNILNDGGIVYYFGFWGHSDWVLINAKKVGLKPLSRIVWWFRTGRPEKFNYRQDTEDCWYCAKGIPKIFNANKYLEPYEDKANYKRYNRLGKHPGTVWIESRILHNHPENVGHPTQKPINIIERMIGISSDFNSIILDPFMGSGTTGVACINLGRKFIGIEIEPKYFDISCKRIEQAQQQLKLAI